MPYHYDATHEFLSYALLHNLTVLLLWNRYTDPGKLRLLAKVLFEDCQQLTKFCIQMTNRLCWLAWEWKEQKQGIAQRILRQGDLEREKEICSKLFNTTIFSMYLCKSHFISLYFHTLLKATKTKTDSVLILC